MSEPKEPTVNKSMTKEDEFCVYQWVKDDVALLDMPAEEIIQRLVEENEKLHNRLIEQGSPKVSREFVEKWAQHDWNNSHEVIRKRITAMLTELGHEIEGEEKK